jgi:hypothetical protein
VKSAVGNGLHAPIGPKVRRPRTRSIPIGEDFLRFDYLLLGAGETEFQFSGLARDLNFDGFEAVAFHAGAELFVGFVDAVFLEAIAHG